MKTIKQVDKIIVHCSDSPEGRDDSAKDIRNWHVKGNGWEDIGYHFVVRLDGTVEAGRDCHYQGAHCSGHNATSIGVCYVGGKGPDGKPKDTRTPQQRYALGALLKSLRRRYPHARIYGHRDFSAKPCPCFDAKTEYADL